MKYTFEILQAETILQSFFRMHRYHLRHSSFHGGWCGEIVRERLEGLSAVSVLLYDPDTDELVLIEQFRIGLMGTADPPWSIETVSGFCDIAHESAEVVARREVIEETGCTLRALTRIGEFFVSPGMSVERITLYCGRVDARTAAGIHGLDHEGEEMRVLVMPRAQAVAELYGRLNTTSVIMAVQWLQAHRGELLQEWAD